MTERRVLSKDVHSLIKNITKLSDGQASVVSWDDEDVSSIIIEIAPYDGLYKGGKYKFKFVIPEDWPCDPPEIVCLTPIFHPNIDCQYEHDLDDLESSNICVSGVFDEWTEQMNLDDCVQTLLFLFYEPNLDDPLAFGFYDGLTHARFTECVMTSLKGGELDLDYELLGGNRVNFTPNYGWLENHPQKDIKQEVEKEGETSVGNEEGKTGEIKMDDKKEEGNIEENKVDSKMCTDTNIVDVTDNQKAMLNNNAERTNTEDVKNDVHGLLSDNVEHANMDVTEDFKSNATNGSDEQTTLKDVTTDVKEMLNDIVEQINIEDIKDSTKAIVYNNVEQIDIPDVKSETLTMLKEYVQRTNMDLTKDTKDKLNDNVEGSVDTNINNHNPVDVEMTCPLLFESQISKKEIILINNDVINTSHETMEIGDLPSMQRGEHCNAGISMRQCRDVRVN